MDGGAMGDGAMGGSWRGRGGDDGVGQRGVVQVVREDARLHQLTG